MQYPCLTFCAVRYISGSRLVGRRNYQSQQGSPLGWANREIEHAQELRRTAEDQQRQHGCRDEVVRRDVEGRPGDRGRGRRLLEEVVRGRQRSGRKAVRRQDAREGDRDPERLCEVRLRGLRGRRDPDRRALCRPDEGELQALRRLHRQGQRRRQVSRRATDAERKARPFRRAFCCLRAEGAIPRDRARRGRGGRAGQLAMRSLDRPVPIWLKVVTIWVGEVSRKNLLVSPVPATLPAQYCSTLDVASPSVLTWIE